MNGFIFGGKFKVGRDWAIGIIGGGQLAKMSVQAANNFSFKIKVLSPRPGYPESRVAGQVGRSFRDPYIVKKMQLRDNEGMGLGLFITKRIVEAHGGSLNFSLPPGRGLEVSISLPKEGSPTS